MEMAGLHQELGLPEKVGALILASPIVPLFGIISGSVLSHETPPQVSEIRIQFCQGRVQQSYSRTQLRRYNLLDLGIPAT